MEAVSQAHKKKHGAELNLRELTAKTSAGYQTLSNFTRGVKIPTAYKLLFEIKKLTGLTFEEILIQNPQDERHG